MANWASLVAQWRRQWHPTPVLLPGKSHGWRSLVGCSPWGCEESDMTEQLHFHFSLSCIGEGNGNPLQWSCLENPRDGITQSQTRLKWFSSSRGLNSEESSCQNRTWRFNYWVRKITWGRKCQPTPVFLSEKSHGQRSLAGCSPWGCKESDMT